MTRRLIPLAALLGGLFILPASGAWAATPETEAAFKAASAKVWDATALIFKCLADARSGLAPAKLNDADNKLQDAILAYEELRKQRAGKQFQPGDYAEQATRIELELKPGSPIKLEEEVIKINQDEIAGLKAQIAAWHGRCEVPTRNPTAFLALFKAKIRVEQASQLSEIAFAVHLK